MGSSESITPVFAVYSGWILAYYWLGRVILRRPVRREKRLQNQF